MDGNFEPDNLDTFIDWNDDDFQATFLQTDTPLTSLEDANLFEHFDSQLDLPPLPSAFETMVEITEPTSGSDEGSSSAVPNPLPPKPTTPLLPATQLSQPLSSAEELLSDGAVRSGQSHDVTLTGYFNELADLQSENSVAHQAIPLYNAQNLMIQPSMPNTIENNIINQSSSFPTLVHPNQTCIQVQPRPVNESGYSSGQLAPPQAPAFTLHNHISNSNAAWNSMPQHTYSSATDAYGAQYAPQYAPNFMQLPQPFTTLHNQVHPSALQQIVDLRSQNSMTPVYATYHRLEPYPNFQLALTNYPANPFQQGYRPVLPDPAAAFAPSLANYGQNPSLQATRGISFGYGSSLHPMYSASFGNQGWGQYHYPQMPIGLGQQTSTSVPQWMMTPNLQSQTNTISSQTLISGMLGHSSTRTTSSRVPNSREAEIAPFLRMQQEATASTNDVQNSRDKGRHQPTSSSGSQPSEAIRRILNMNPARAATWDTRFINEQFQNNNMANERVPYVPPRRGRPPKRRDIEGSSSQPRKSQKISTEKREGGTSVASQGAQRTPENLLNRDQNAILPNPNPLAAPSHSVQTAYDKESEGQGPLDPKLLKPSPGN